MLDEPPHEHPAATTASPVANAPSDPERPGTVAIVARVTARLEDLLRGAFPDASEIAVEDRTGGGDHFHVTVVSSRFEGLGLVDQHRLVYDALAEPLADGTIHELRISTRSDT